MFIRRRRAAATLISSLLLVGGLIVGGIATAGPALAVPIVTIHLTNAPQFCINISYNNNRSGDPLQLWTCSGSGDDRWYEIPDPNCFEGLCMQFQDVNNTSLCMSASGSHSGYVDLGSCNSGLGTWYSTCYPGHLGNGFWANSGDLTVYGPLGNGNHLYAQPCVAPGGAAWQNWSGY